MTEEMKFEVLELFKVPHGSRLYGTETEGSDYDWISVYLPTKEMLWAEIIPPTRHVIIGDQDTKYLSLPRFLRLLAKGDMSCLEAWAYLCNKYHNVLSPEEKYLASTDLLVEVLYFPCVYRENITNKISAYLRSIFREYYGPLDLINQTRVADGIKDIVLKYRLNLPAPIISTPKKLYQLVRLIDQALELHKTGNLIFPRPTAEILKGIKTGSINPSSEIITLYENCEENQWLSAFGIGENDTLIPLTPSGSKDIKQMPLDNLDQDIMRTMRWVDRLGPELDNCLPKILI